MDTISFYLKGGRTEISEHLDRHGIVAVVAENRLFGHLILIAETIFWLS